jgi:PAS domain-containing protein
VGRHSTDQLHGSPDSGPGDSRARRERPIDLTEDSPGPARAPDREQVWERLIGDPTMFRGLVDYSSDLIGLATLDGRPVYLNPAGCELLGCPSLDDAL